MQAERCPRLHPFPQFRFRSAGEHSKILTHATHLTTEPSAVQDHPAHLLRIELYASYIHSPTMSIGILYSVCFFPLPGSMACVSASLQCSRNNRRRIPDIMLRIRSGKCWFVNVPDPFPGLFLVVVLRFSAGQGFDIPQTQWSQFPAGELAPFRLTLQPTKLLPLAVVGCSPLCSTQNPREKSPGFFFVVFRPLLAASLKIDRFFSRQPGPREAKQGQAIGLVIDPLRKSRYLSLCTIRQV